MDDVLVIDCDTCWARRPAVCQDCVVTFICNEDGPGAGGPGGTLVRLTAPHLETLRLLHDAGLVPGLRHQPAPT